MSEQLKLEDIAELVEFQQRYRELYDRLPICAIQPEYILLQPTAMQELSKMTGRAIQFRKRESVYHGRFTHEDIEYRAVFNELPEGGDFG